MSKLLPEPSSEVPPALPSAPAANTKSAVTEASTASATSEPAGLASAPSVAQVIAETLHWLEAAVIGLNLCPFAKAVHVRGQIRVVVSHARTPEALLAELIDELKQLEAADPEQVDTTLLIHPQVLNDFLDFNDFLDPADGALEALDLDGVLQIASFHPQFQFDGTAEDDMGNFSNRAPYPTLHLLREESIDRAVTAFPEADAIFERNIERLQALGLAGWKDLLKPQA